MEEFAPFPDSIFSQSDPEQIIDVIENRVIELLNSDTGLLFSSLYRLDVSEKFIQQAFMTEQDETVSRKLAILIYTRQKERAEVKKQIKVKPITDPDYIF
ncbi:MAG: hypothetical protein R2774_12585 [Saprospiraceae bacterium]